MTRTEHNPPNIIILFLLLLLSACAATSATVLDEEVVTNAKPMTSYRNLVIRDFELKKELVSETSPDKMGERDRMYMRLPDKLAVNLERYVRARRIYQNVSRTESHAPDTVVLKGSFTRIGRFRISIEGMLNDASTGQEVAYFRHTHWDVLDAAESVNEFAREVAYFIDRIQYK